MTSNEPDSSDNIDDDEIAVVLVVKQLGSCEISAVIQREEAYLSVKDVFNFLKIRVYPTSNADSVSGYFLSPDKAYSINKLTGQIVYAGKIYQLKLNELLHTATNLYLKATYFSEIFGLECKFDFRSLSISLTTKLEIPAIREMENERLRQNIKLLKGERTADTTIKRAFPFLSIGMADWSVVNTLRTNGGNNTRLDLNLGGLLAGGETNAYLSLNTEQELRWQDQRLRWRYVNNNNKGLRQVTLGSVYTTPTATLFGSINGIQVTNAPTTYRRSFGTYRLSDKTQPDWTVELYINNVLVDYTKADASGFYTFNVPLVYGSSTMKLRFYGPWGEELSREQNMNVPFNFLPKKEFEYNLTAGEVNDGNNTKFSRLNMGYGLTNQITIGSGAEYLSSPDVVNNKWMPFVNASVRIGSNLIFTGEHSYGIRSKGLLKYQSPSSLQFELSYTKYKKGQTAIRQGKSPSSFNEERKAIFFIPIRMSKFSAFSRITYSETRFDNFKYTSAECLVSANFGNVSTNLTTNSLFSDPAKALIYSDLALGFRLPHRIRFMPRVRYEWHQSQINTLRTDLEKAVSNKGYLNLIFERNIELKNSTVSLGFRYNFSFARTSVSVVHTKDASYSMLSASGGLLFNDRLNYLRASDKFSQGRGGLVFVSFLDLNDNGKWDKDEPKVNGLKLQSSGGQIEINRKDSTVSLRGLEAYVNYFIQLDKNSFENIGWEIKNSTLNVTIEPNHYKMIEVPVRVIGEVSGMVFLTDKSTSEGIGRVIINFYNSAGAYVGRTLSEQDGYFSFVGLTPGEYTAKVDEEQLQQLNMKATPSEVKFTVKRGFEGDIVEGLRITLESNDPTKPKPGSTD